MHYAHSNDIIMKVVVGGAVPPMPPPLDPPLICRQELSTDIFYMMTFQLKNHYSCMLANSIN